MAKHKILTLRCHTLRRHGQTQNSNPRLPATKELIANNKSIEEIKNHIGADELIYQDLEDLILAAKRGNPDIIEFEDSVFTGKYRTGNITNEYLDELEKSRCDKARVIG